MGIRYTKEQSEFIKSFQMITKEGITCYSIPFYFVEVSENVFEMLNFEDLPQGIKDTQNSINKSNFT